jgi:NAD-dependent aldehyde dehydrogenases
MKMIINGEKRNSRDGRTIDIINPATQELIDMVPSATKEDVEEAIEVAQIGKEIWGDTPLYERTRILTAFSSLLLEKKEELASLVSKETARLMSTGRKNIDIASFLFKGFAEKANHIYGKTMPPSEKGYENDIVFTVREPLGVVVCIIPFNQPIKLYAFKVAAALAAGNAVIIKPPSDCPLTLIRMTEMLIECGVPKETVQIITGKGSVTGDYLVSSSRIDAVTFTGSTDIGVHIAELGAKHLHKIFLELGGNDALIIMDDADVEHAVEEAYLGRITYQGQVCCAAKRFIVHNSIRKEFTDKLIEKLKRIKIGDPSDPTCDITCMINEKAAIEVENQIRHTVEQGAKCVFGGSRFDKTFITPAILSDVTPDMDVAKDMEIFGPVIPIIGFDTMEEAIRIANNSVYGLMAGVISRDMNKALKIASKTKAGGVVVNGSGFYRTSEMPFGGYKMSGMGREGIVHSIEELTQEKTIILKGVLK